VNLRLWRWFLLFFFLSTGTPHNVFEHSNYVLRVVLASDGDGI